MWTVLTIFLLALTVQISCHQTPSEPYPHQYNPYSYGYDVEDNYGNKQWRKENSHNPMEVHGTYGYRDNTGIYREVTYVADKNGFRASIKTNEPGLAGTKDPASVKMDSYHTPPVVHSTRHIRSGPSHYYKSRTQTSS